MNKTSEFDLNLNNFFSHLYFKPEAARIQDQNRSRNITILTGVFSLGVIPLIVGLGWTIRWALNNISSCLTKKNISRVNESKPHVQTASDIYKFQVQKKEPELPIKQNRTPAFLEEEKPPREFPITPFLPKTDTPSREFPVTPSIPKTDTPSREFPVTPSIPKTDTPSREFPVTPSIPKTDTPSREFPSIPTSPKNPPTPTNRLTNKLHTEPTIHLPMQPIPPVQPPKLNPTLPVNPVAPIDVPRSNAPNMNWIILGGDQYSSNSLEQYSQLGKKELIPHLSGQIIQKLPNAPMQNAIGIFLINIGGDRLNHDDHSFKANFDKLKTLTQKDPIVVLMNIGTNDTLSKTQVEAAFGIDVKHLLNVKVKQKFASNHILSGSVSYIESSELQAAKNEILKIGMSNKSA